MILNDIVLLHVMFKFNRKKNSKTVHWPSEYHLFLLHCICKLFCQSTALWWQVTCRCLAPVRLIKFYFWNLRDYFQHLALVSVLHSSGEIVVRYLIKLQYLFTVTCCQVEHCRSKKDLTGFCAWLLMVLSTLRYLPCRVLMILTFHCMYFHIKVQAFKEYSCNN